MPPLLIAILLFPVSGMAADADSSWLQLNKLNQASRLELESIQQDRALTPPLSRHQEQRLQRLYRDQKIQQQLLQQQQRRRLLILDQRKRITLPNATPTDRPRSLFQQQLFRQQQLNQLQRFRTQQLLSRPR